MVPPLGIFQLDSAGAMTLCGLAETIDEAKTQIKELATRPYADYLIMSLKDGEEIIVNAADINGMSKSVGA